MSSFLMSIFAFVVVLSPLVFFHELGHYWAAKACGVHVERFSIGFGPKIFSWTDRSGTEWTFSWIFLGGYVEMLGDANVSSSVSKTVPKEDIARTLEGKTHAQRIMIAAAGPAVNYVLAFVLFVTLFVAVGRPYHTPVVGDIEIASLAYESGIRSQDRIETVQGQPVATFQDVIQVLKKTPADQPLTVSVLRDNERLDYGIKPPAGATGKWLGKLKISPDNNSRFYEKQSLQTAISTTLSAMNPMTMLKSLGLDSMGGPIAIAYQAGNVIQQGWAPVLFLMGGLSLGLGFFNLLPFPLLDGGMILIETISWATGVPVSMRIRQVVSMLAFGFLGALFVFLSWTDLCKIPAIAAFLGKQSWVKHQQK